MKYVIDTTERGGAWTGAFGGGLVLVHVEDISARYELSEEDVIFAHTPTDFCLGNPASRNVNISAFIAAVLRTIGSPKGSPLFVLYSGDGFNDREKEATITQCVASALPNYPRTRVDVFLDSFDREEDPTALRATIHRALGDDI